MRYEELVFKPLRHCLKCGDIVQYGRADKKFCSDACRQSFWNSKNKDYRGYHTKVQNSIERNYRVLDKILRLGLTRLSMEDALLLGFKPDYFTGQNQPSGRKIKEYYNYEIRYKMSSNKIYSIRRVTFGLSADP